MLGRVILTPAVALLSVAALANPSLAEEPFRLFHCAVGDSYSDKISLYAHEHEDGSWSDLQFVVEKDGIIRILVKDAPGAEKSRFLFSNSEGPEGYYAQVRFSQAGRQYRLAMLDIPPDPAEELDMGGRAAGLTVTDPAGASYELPCGETDEYIGYMQEAMSCDMANRYGAAGCDFGVRPTRAPDDKLPSSVAP